MDVAAGGNCAKRLCPPLVGGLRKHCTPASGVCVPFTTTLTVMEMDCPGATVLGDALTLSVNWLLFVAGGVSALDVAVGSTVAAGVAVGCVGIVAWATGLGVEIET